MEKNNVEEPASTVDKPEAINYRGVKAMPFIIGKIKNRKHREISGNM